MKNYTTEEPKFSDTLPITEFGDIAHPDTINPAPIQAFENTLCNQKAIRQIEENLGEVIFGKFNSGIFSDNIKALGVQDDYTPSQVFSCMPVGKASLMVITNNSTAGAFTDHLPMKSAPSTTVFYRDGGEKGQGRGFALNYLINGTSQHMAGVRDDVLDTWIKAVQENETGGLSVGNGLQLETYTEVEAEFTCNVSIAGSEILEFEYDSGYGPTLSTYGFRVSVASQEGPANYLSRYEGRFLGDDKDVDYSNNSYDTDTSAFDGVFVQGGKLYFCYASEENAQHVLEYATDTCTVKVGTRRTNTYDNQFIFGSYNNHNFRHNSALVIGAGSNATGAGRKNALRLTKGSALYLGAGGAYNSSGADHAEFVKEWWDGNPDNEDRVGYLVTVKEGLLYKAEAGDCIVGITSGNPCVVGNADEEYSWKYERDEFNRLVMEKVPEEVQKTDEEGYPVLDDAGEPVMVGTGHMVEVPKISGSYDPSRPYVERKDRPEWDYVGMLGVLPVRDDGTCIPGRFCKCKGGGIGTLAEERGFDTFFVLERISENVVSVELRGV